MVKKKSLLMWICTFAAVISVMLAVTGLKAYAADSEGEEITTPDVVEKQITDLKVVSNSETTIVLSWSGIENVDGYIVYSTYASGAVSSTAAKCDGTATGVTLSNKKSGSMYHFKVVGYVDAEDDTRYFSIDSNIVATCAKPVQITGLNKSANTTSSITLTWDKVYGATQYRVYRYNTATGEYKWLKTLDSSTRTYTNTSLSSGSLYTYRVRAIKIVEGTTYYGKYCSGYTTNTKVPAPTLNSLTAELKSTTSKWSKVSTATGYQLWRYDATTGAYIKVKTIRSNSTCTFKNTASALKLNTKYTYKVRAYKVVDGKTLYSDYSSTKNITMKITICVDPGHVTAVNNNGDDYDNVLYGYSEAKMSLELGNNLKKQLESYGFTVVMTRTTDEAPTLALADRGLLAKGCDFFISLHSNADASAYKSAPSAFCNINGNAASLGIGKLLTAAVSDTMGTSQAGVVCQRESDDEPGKDYYCVLRNAMKVGVPGILMEHSYHTNATSRAWLLSSSNLTKLAKAEAKVFAQYYGVA